MVKTKKEKIKITVVNKKNEYNKQVLDYLDKLHFSEKKYSMFG